MRGKIAKKLRRLAREAMPNEPERNYMQHKKTGQIVLGKSQRAAYQKIKKAYKDGLLTSTGQSITERIKLAV